MSRFGRHLTAILLLSFVAIMFSGCSVGTELFSSPQNVFAPAGEVAQDQKDLFFFVMWFALGIFILVEVGLLVILVRFRHKKGDPLPKQVHGNNALEIGWTVAPMILLAFFVVPTVAGIVELGRTPKDAMQVDVTGTQWKWLFSYPQEGGAPIDGPIGELHIPIGRKIDIQLHSADVIHSFWVPKLAGKTDVIPGRTNHMWLKGDEIGSFSGQCAEFCGLDHAQMRFTVIVESQEDFDAWLKTQSAARQPDASQPELAVSGD